jgi:lysyl-tRNA synthetase class 2
MGGMGRIRAPSDLIRREFRSKSRVTLGGRVVFTTGREHDLADAFARVRVVGREAWDLDPGDLMVVRGRPSRARLVDAELLARWALPEPRADGEFARQSWRGVGRHLRERARVMRVIRDYFDRRGFCEVDTPLLGQSPGFDPLVEGLRAEAGWLVTSPEQALKRLLVGGLPRIYQLSHAFRADERGIWHTREFLLLEWYRAFSGMEAVIRDTEQLVLRIARLIRGKSQLVLPDGRELDVTPPYPRWSVAEAFAQYAGVDDAYQLAAVDEPRIFELLIERVEPALAALPTPVILWHYPVSQAALARPCPEDPRAAERFELYAGGVELCNGFGELTDAREHQRRLRDAARKRRRLGRPAQPADPSFLAAVVEGLPPSAGNALGVDRLVTLATGARNLAEVQPLADSLIRNEPGK